MPLLNLHTHLPAPKVEAIISCEPEALPDSSEWPGQLYSVGVHPWSLPATGLDEGMLSLLEESARRDDVAAIGECGIDLTHPGAAPLFRQLLCLKEHIRISETVGKPLILHCVKAWDSIVGLRKEYSPSQPWIVHGFRGKPSVLEMLLRGGIDVSYGERFNPESVAATPPERLFAETDDSVMPIEEIISRLGEANPAVSKERIERNIRGLLAR